MAPDSDSQVPIFLERVRGLFRASPDESRRGDEDPSRGGVIAVCVLLSLLLWLSLTLQEQRMVTIQFPVEVINLEDDQALVERPPSAVSAQVEGSGLELLRLMFTPPPVRVPPGGGSVDVKGMLDLSRKGDLQVENVTPRTIDLKTEPRMERRVPVQARVEVNPASAHELIDEPTVTPESVRVYGAKSILDSLSAWPTESRVLNEVRDTVQVDVALRDSLEGLVERNIDRITYVVRAGKFAEETREVDVEVTGVPTGQNLVALQPSTIRIRYRVLFEELFASRRSSEFFATVAYSQIRSDTTGYVEPHIHVPSDLHIRDPEPIPPRLRYYTFLTDE